MYDEKTAERVRKALARVRNVSERKMMGTLSFMIDDALTCCVSDQSLMVRVTAENRAAALREPHVSTMKMGKREVRTFVLVAPEGIATSGALRAWIERGREANAGEPKKTKKTKE